MQKKIDKTLLISSLVCLLPLILSIAVYSKLPEEMAIHWDSSGTPNGFAPKFFGAFGLPILMLLTNVFMHICLNNDPKKNNASTTVRVIGKWVMPILSAILVPMTLLLALGMDLEIKTLMSLITGISFIIFGNYLPKCRQNYMVGIRLPSTLHSEENWNKTHRLGGYTWMIGGILMIGGIFFQSPFPFFGIFTFLILIPAGYSFLLFKKGI